LSDTLRPSSHASLVALRAIMRHDRMPLQLIRKTGIRTSPCVHANILIYDIGYSFEKKLLLLNRGKEKIAARQHAAR